MKLFHTLIALAVCLSVGRAADDKPAPSMPSEVTLTSGRVLRNVQVIRWESNRVVLKHSGGADPIAFSLFKVPAPSELPAIRATAVAKTAAEAPKQTDLSGQVFVTTRGAMAYKFSGARVRAYDINDWEAMRSIQSSNLPSNFRRASEEQQEVMAANAWIDAAEKATPLANTTTDTEGGFQITLPAGREVFLLCAAGRQVGRDNEQNVWAVKVPAGAKRFDLNNLNAWKQPE